MSTGPSREDHGDLIVLHLRGTQRQMGRQHAELLGPLARGIYEIHREDWDRLIRQLGAAGTVANAILPAWWMGGWRRFERSGLYEFVLGVGDALKVSPANAWRGVFGFLGSGTTTFLAGRSATADGAAMIGKNSDWSDLGGRRAPVVMDCQPAGGLRYIGAGWPLIPFPHTAVNEAGFALGINFFNANEVLALALPRWPVMTAVTSARTVAEGLRIVEGARNRGMSGFISMADAGGDCAVVEATPSKCAVLRPDGDWLGQTNHARTTKMIPHDRGRSWDSMRRLAAMEAAVRSQLGKITPEIAADILRDRSSSPFVNESTVANASVLNSAVVHTGSRTLWHSTTKQPIAPFGEMLPFTPDDGPAKARAIPADPRLGSVEFERETRAVVDLRRACGLFAAGSVQDAAAIWDSLAANAGAAIVEPYRLAWARARVAWTQGRLDDAVGLLSEALAEGTPFDVRANALVASAMIADHQGRRDDAVRLYESARDYLRANDFNDGLISPLASRIKAGLAAAQTEGALPETPHLQRVPW